MGWCCDILYILIIYKLYYSLPNRNQANTFYYPHYYLCEYLKNTNLFLTIFSNQMKKPNLPLMQGKPRLLAQQPRNGPTGSTLSLAELAEQYEESNYSTPITLKLNSAYPTL